MKTKNFLASFAMLILLLTGTQTIAQNDFHIVYDLEINSDDAMANAMMQDAKLEIMFHADYAKVAMDLGIMNTTAITKESNKEGLVLMDMMGMKIAVPMTEKDFDKEEDEGEVTVRETGKSKKVAGFTCKQAFVTNEDGQEFEIWYTPDIKPANQSTDYSYEGVDGFPLEMHINQDGMEMHMEATSVSQKQLSKADFSMEIPDGYQEMSMEDLERMGGGR